MPRRHAPGQLEAAILRRLRASGQPMTGRQLWQSFAEEQDGPARTTVLTVLARLEHKGLVEKETTAGLSVYRPASSESEAVAAAMRSLLTQAGDPRAVLTQFAGLLGDEDRRMLSALDPGDAQDTAE